MTQSVFSSLRQIELKPVAAPAPWQAFRIELPAFPLPEQPRAALSFLVTRLIRALAEVYGLRPTLWLDTAKLHRDGAARLFSSYARRWSPTMGFAFDPTGPAPRTLELSDLMDAPWGTSPKIYDRSAVVVSNIEQTEEAYRVMSGRGLASMFFFAVDASALFATIDRFMRNSRATLEPLVASNAFKHHNFYLPLLSADSLVQAGAKDLAAWIGEVEVYCREVFENQEVLLLARRDWEPVFRRLEMRRLGAGEGSAA
jgi:hypothetical protein